MDSFVNHIKVTRTARYYILGDNSLPPEILIYVLHGYGMKAKKFIHEFENLIKPGVWVIAPEGLSRFYQKGFSGEVVASWMTSDDRLLEIDDYVAYLDAVHNSVVSGKHTKVIILGFSQGAATASRWITKGNVNPEEFVIWGGEFAFDVTNLPSKLPKIRLVHALQDEFISHQSFLEQSRRLELAGFEVEKLEFEGTHAIEKEILSNVFQSIDHKFY